jgi:hypothetical protein
MSKRTKPQPTDAALEALKVSLADADIANHHAGEDAANLSRLYWSIDREIAVDKTTLEYLEGRVAAGKVDEQVVVELEIKIAGLEGRKRDIFLDFERAANVWRGTAQVAKAMRAAVDERRNALKA